MDISSKESFENEKIPAQIYLVKGMDCPSCALTLEKGVENLAGVEAVTIHYATQKMRVIGLVEKAEVLSRVRALGYDLDEKTENLQASESQSTSFNLKTYIQSRNDAWLFLIGLLLILPGVILEEILGIQHLIINLSSVGALIVAGLPVFKNALRSIRYSREININVLMSIAGIGAAIIGAFTEAGMVMVLFLLGEILEGYTGERSRRAINQLMDLVPQDALLIQRDGKEITQEQIPVHELRINDHILVKPGERIPMDGQIVSGSSSVNQASITGESKPVVKTPGVQVFASSINGEGSLQIVVTHLSSDNTISRLIRLVEEAQEKRAPAQRFVDRFAKIYTPLVVGIAFLVAVVPPIFFQQPFLNPDSNTLGWLYRGLALLVVGCPCALVISTPVSIISAISNAAKHGILVKGGVFLEEMNNVKVIAMDKTGTLTRGRPRVVDIRAVNCPSREATGNMPLVSSDNNGKHLLTCKECQELIAVAGAVELLSEHPLANAIVEKAKELDLLDRYSSENVTALSGRGIKGKINGSVIIIGSHQYFDEHYPHLEVSCFEAKNDTLSGLTPLMISKDDTYLGTIAVADTIRESSPEAVQSLRSAGIESIAMLTGDEEEVAKRIAKEVGVDEYHAQLLPEDKVNVVQRLRHLYGKIAMVGDGINDAPALAAANVGIAIGGAFGGTAQAMETADVTLMSDDLRILSFLVRLSKSTMQTVYFNVGISILVKVVFLFLVLLGYGTMWMAVFADMGTSLLVTFNGLRLLRRPTPES